MSSTAKKTKHLGLESGKSSSTWFTPAPKQQPHTGNGESGSTLLRGVKLIFRSANGKRQK